MTANHTDTAKLLLEVVSFLNMFLYQVYFLSKCSRKFWWSIRPLFDLLFALDFRGITYFLCNKWTLIFGWCAEYWQHCDRCSKIWQPCDSSRRCLPTPSARTRTTAAPPAASAASTLRRRERGTALSLRKRLVSRFSLFVRNGSNPKVGESRFQKGNDSD